MHTPTKQQWQTVIENFQRVLPLAKQEYHLDMIETTISDFEHKCGTVHCVAGWYGVATLKIENNGEYVSYTCGANKMAEHLGFEEIRDLESWGRANPSIWGNARGFNMFSSESAYDGAATLHEVIEFLEKVRDRSPE